MIKKYNDFLNEKLTDNLSGFNEQEILNQYLNKQIHIYTYLDLVKQYNLKLPSEETFKQYIFDGKMRVTDYNYLCKYNNYKCLTNDEMKKLFLNNKIDITDYIYYCKSNNLDLPTKDEYFDVLSKLEPDEMLFDSIYSNNLDGIKLAFSKNAKFNDNSLLYINNIDVLKYLDEYGIDISTNNDVLRRSIENGNIEIVKYMLDNYYDIENAEEDKLINTCILYKQYNTLKIILEHGATVTIDDIKNIIDDRKFDDLYLLIQHYKGDINNIVFEDIIYKLIVANKIEIIKYLLEHGYIIKYKYLPKKMSDDMKKLLQQYDKEV